MFIQHDGYVNWYLCFYVFMYSVLRKSYCLNIGPRQTVFVIEYLTYLELSSVRVIKCSNYRVFELSSVRVIECSSYRVFELSNVRVIECSNYRVFELSSFRVIECSSYRVFELSSVRVTESQLNWEASDFLFSILLYQNTRTSERVIFRVVSCPPVVDVVVSRPDVKYQLGFSVQNGTVNYRYLKTHFILKNIHDAFREEIYFVFKCC